jgi:hypothetical protein
MPPFQSEFQSGGKGQWAGGPGIRSDCCTCRRGAWPSCRGRWRRWRPRPTAAARPPLDRWWQRVFAPRPKGPPTFRQEAAPATGIPSAGTRRSRPSPRGFAVEHLDQGIQRWTSSPSTHENHRSFPPLSHRPAHLRSTPIQRRYAASFRRPLRIERIRRHDKIAIRMPNKSTPPARRSTS